MPQTTIDLLTTGLVWNLPRVESAAASAQLPPEPLARIRHSARNLLTVKPFSVTNKSTTPPSGDKHDYMSVGPYWWPDPASADGLPFIRRDGEVHPDFNLAKYDHSELANFTDAVRDLTLLSLIDRNSAFAEKAAQLIRVWFLDSSTRMNPNLQFAQGIPGRCTGRGIGLIDTKSFVEVLDCTLLLHHAGAISSSDLAALQTWFSSYLDWMLTHEFGQKERCEHNNHGTWCDVQLAAFALFVQRPDLAREVIAEVPQRRIIAHIAPDGSQPHELARTRSLSYSCFNLQGLFNLAWLGRHLDMDLWAFRSEDGRSLQAAIDWLLPYANPATTWPYQQISKEGTADNPSLGATARAPLVPLLHQATLAFADPKYAQALNLLPEARQVFTPSVLWQA